MKPPFPRRSALPCLGAFALTLTLASACSNEGSTLSSAGADPTRGCDGRCADSADFLSQDEVARILAQGVHEARARGVQATLAVVDRVGNVLGVFRMGDKRERFTLIASAFEDANGVIDGDDDVTLEIFGGLEGLKLPEPNRSGGGTFGNANLDHLAAIAKAVTGAFLSTEGMAFTSRTANQIVQDHFNPGEDFQPGGPLFGVQFSQLACSDFLETEAVTFEAVSAPGATGAGGGPPPAVQLAVERVPEVAPGPHHSPLGLAADPGGLPLYQNGSLVGGIGVMADSVYGLDPFIGDTDFDLDEAIAVAASFGFEAPVDRRATVTVEGKVFRYTDVDDRALASDPRAAPALDSIPVSEGRVIAVRGYVGAELRDGTPFGMPESGIRADAGENFPADLDAFVFVDASNSPRYAPRGGLDSDIVGGSPLTAAEVRSVLENALEVANSSRAQIRRPLGTQARVTISVVDSRGEVLGMVRSRDAPVFGADVALQKARTSAFLSSEDAAEFLLNPALSDAAGVDDPVDGFPTVFYVLADPTPGLLRFGEVFVRDYLVNAAPFLGLSIGGLEGDALDEALRQTLDGDIAFTDRAGGNLSRPFYPDGINGNPPGPFSKPPGEWSVFSTGFQLDVSHNAIVQHALYAATGNEDGTVPFNVRTAFPPLRETGCAGRGLNVANRPPVREVADTARLGNGVQIFPGSVPIYRGRQLVGAIGVSGDGVDQDDLIAFAGVHNAGLALGGSIGNAPRDMRADQLEPLGVRLRYAQCPQAPFLGSDEDNVCDGF